MKENFFTSMISEKGKISHKRFISVVIAGVLCWTIIFSTLKATLPAERQTLINAVMIFILIMSGVATVAQVVSLVKGTPPPKGEENKTD
jgi:uncharacterized membrane protein YdjX (TVP38/TMEM64 family)